VTADTGVLPRGWTISRVGDVVALNPRAFDTEPQKSDLVSFVPMAAVEAATGKLNASQARLWADVDKGYTRFQEGDVVFAKITPCMENGKFALAKGLIGGRAAGSTEFHVMRPREAVLPEFLLHFVLQQSFRDEAQSKMRGAAGQLRVPPEILDEAPIPIPPLNEQRRIVAAIETQFTRLDAAVAALERTRANLKRYRAAVLKAACEGRLVPTEAELARAEGRDFESGDQLLARIYAAARDATASHHRGARSPNTASRRSPRGGERPALTPISLVNQAEQPAPFQPPLGGLSGLSAGTLAPRGDGRDDPMRNVGDSTNNRAPRLKYATALPGDLPEGWAWAKVNQVGQVKLGRQRSPDHHSGPHMRPYLRVANVFEARLDLGDVMEMNFTPSEFEQYKLEYGDILLNEGQSIELVGRPAMFRNEIVGACFQNTLVRFRAFDEIDRHFALIVFRAYLHGGGFQRIARWTVNIAHLGAERFANLVFPLPPLAEQHRIVAEVERRLSVVDDLEKTIEANLKRAERLRQAILARAFAGNLVPQDPTDEPASVLLERIRAERAVNEVPARRSRKGSRAAQMQERLL
jgi:type I restriction enzyme S subunit